MKPGITFSCARVAIPYMVFGCLSYWNLGNLCRIEKSVVQKSRSARTISNQTRRTYDTYLGTENMDSSGSRIIGFSRRCLICVPLILGSRSILSPLHDYAPTPSTSNTSSGRQPFSSRLLLNALPAASLLEITNAERLSSVVARPS
jgi:hypothetical protein